MPQSSKPSIFTERRTGRAFEPRRVPPKRTIGKVITAIIRRRNHRANTDDGVLDDPSHNARAAKSIAIIFGVHIVAIVLYFVHWSFLSKHTTTPASASVSPPAQTVAETGGTFTVSRGDTYTTIANHLGIPEDAIRAANPVLTPGTKLVIPPKPANAPAPRDTTARGSAPDDGLMDANPEVTEPSEGTQRQDPAPGKATPPKSSTIKSAAVKTPPKAITTVDKPKDGKTAAPATGSRSYTVRSGDNLWRISKRLKVDQDALMRANGITDPNKLKVGMALKLP